MTRPGKRGLREALRLARAAMPERERAEADARIAELVSSLDLWRAAPTVLTYLSVGCEVSTRVLVARALEEGKGVALPRVAPGTRSMRWYLVDGLDEAEPGPLGVPEPPARPDREVDPRSVPSAVALVPGLAFDRRGYRIGYGGGFYDGFLSAFPGVSVGLCRAGLLVDDLASLSALEPHDVPVDLVATDVGLVFGRGAAREGGAPPAAPAL